LLAGFVEGHEFIHKVDAGPARGLKYPVTLPQDKGIWTGTYELEFSENLAAAVRPGDVCLDVGGWRGFFSGVFGLAGARRVYTFEPLPANCAQIHRLVELNPQLPLTLFEVAVGEKAGQLEFCIMPQSSMGKLAASSFQQEEKGQSRIQVQVVSLDELLAQGKIEPPGVVKIDVEGAEVFVLRGAKRLLAQYQPRLFLEIHSRELAKECEAILTGAGYNVRVMETGRAPDFANEPEVCHFAALPKRGTSAGQPAAESKALRPVDVPILLYHHLVADRRVEPALYEISITQFEQQLDALRRWGFTTLSLQRLFEIIEGDEPLPRRPVVITFDDAFRSFIELGLPALRARNMTASVFVPAGEMGGTNRWDSALGFPERAVMNEAEIGRIMQAGIEVGVHGWVHRNLTRCSDDELREEIFRSREEMKRRLGAAPQFFAYPYGGEGPRLYPLLAEAGYQGAVGIFSNEPTVTTNRFCLRRVYIHSGDTMLRFRLKLSKPYLRYKAFRGVPA
jgi:FkbM family methyltransferase